jgi:hypothetical protein
VPPSSRSSAEDSRASCSKLTAWMAQSKGGIVREVIVSGGGTGIGKATALPAMVACTAWHSPQLRVGDDRPCSLPPSDSGPMVGVR